MSGQPRFSIITPVSNSPLRLLAAMLKSVRRQTDGDWEHCIVDDCSSYTRVAPLLQDVAARDPRIKLHRRSASGGIVAASNDALAMATGEFVALLSHDDQLDERAIEVMGKYIDSYQDVDVLYSDEDKIDQNGRHSDINIKPGWSPDRLVAQMYTNHLSVLRASVVSDVGGFRLGTDGAEDWDLTLRATAVARRVVHVPEVLYHGRTGEGSAAGHADAKPWAHDVSQRVVSEHVARAGIQATVEPVPDHPGHYWLNPALPDEPLVSVVIPSGGKTQVIDGSEVPLVVNCVRTLVRRSNYENLEIVVVLDDHADPHVGAELREIAGQQVRLVEYDRPFNFSDKINTGAGHASGQFLLLLNDDIEVPPPAWRPSPRGAPDPVPRWPTLTGGALRTWIESMVVYARQPGVGAVGAKLCFPDGRLQHNGVVAIGGLVGHCYYGVGGNTCGYQGNLIVPSNFLAVTGACLMTTREAFDAAAGFDVDLVVNYNDVDFCLRLRAMGYRSVVVPHVELIHRESASRGVAPVRPDEIAALQARWGDLLYHDPYYDNRFVDGNFGLPTANGPLARARGLYRQGGPQLVLSTVLSKVRRQLSTVAV